MNFKDPRRPLILAFVSDISNGDISYVYDNTDDISGVLTVNFETGAIYGVFEVSGQSYKMESLESLSHVVWAEIDQQQFQDVEPKEDEESMEVDIMRSAQHEKLLAKGRADKTSIVEYSITVYYTAGFKRTTADPETFIDQVYQHTPCFINIDDD